MTNTIEQTFTHRGYGIILTDDGEVCIITANGDFVDSGFDSVDDAKDYIDDNIVKES